MPRIASEPPGWSGFVRAAGAATPARRIRPGRWLVVAALLLGASLLPACTTRDEASLLYPRRGLPFQECDLDLSPYRSVQERPGGQDPTLALAVAVSGGGHRAANFGAGVLLALEELTRGVAPRPNALAEIDYFSTVSGGGMAAAAYVSSLHDHLEFGGAYEDYSLARALARAPRPLPPIHQQRTDPLLKSHLERNYLNDLIDGAFSLATLGALNRGDWLAQVLDDHVLGCRWRQEKRKSLSRPSDGGSPSLTLGDVFPRLDKPGSRVRLPYWVANATVYENGAIFPFTQDHLRLYQVRGYRHRLAPVTHDPNRQTYDDFLDQVPLSLGLMASGNFPVAIPATTVTSGMDPKNPYLYLLDGGMADNLGVITGLRLLRQDKHPAVERRVLIVVDAYSGTFAPFSNSAGAPMMLTTAFRTTTAFLDSWRGRYRRVVDALAKSPDLGPSVQVVYLSFDDLAELKDFGPLLGLGLRESDLKELKAKPRPVGLEATPFTLARAIPTWFALSPAEENLMLSASRYVVQHHCDEIREALGWAGSPGTRPASRPTGETSQRSPSP